MQFIQLFTDNMKKAKVEVEHILHTCPNMLPGRVTKTLYIANTELVVT